MKKPTAPKAAPKARVTRTKPAREKPAREAATMFRPPTPPAETTVDKAVDNAYRVLDEHLQRGREVAQARAATSPPRPSESVPGDPARRVLRAMADTWNAWSELVSPLAAKVTKEVGASRRIREALAPTADAEFNELDKRWHEVRPSFLPDAPTDQPMAVKARSRQVDAAVSVAVDVSASQRHAVRVEFHRLALAADLAVLALQPIDGKGAAAIDGFALIVEDDGGVVLRGDVPDGQAAGTYVGAIVERGTGRHTGGVTLTLRG